MKAAIIRFPGSNCDQDCEFVLREQGFQTEFVWHKDTSAAGFDLIVLPGGFSYGDYLRCGAIARYSPIMKSVIEQAAKGVLVLGICNGFQILCESGLLPGALVRNRDLRFICEHVQLRVESTASPFLSGSTVGSLLNIPIAHGEGNYVCDATTLAQLNAENRVLLRYSGTNPNGATENIAGICNAARNVFGLMPHPERACDPHLGSTDGRIIFQIIDVKETEVAKILPKADYLRAAALERNDFRGFAAALDQGRDENGDPLSLALIAEVKKASPSAGVISPDFDAVATAEAYEAAGAHCISVLTDEQFFQGSLGYLAQIRRATRLPLLRKDFTIHPVQIWEASVAGADAILLIVAALDQPQLELLYKEALACQLDVLVEVHTHEEMERAIDLGATLIGINNRNLHTFEVDLTATEQLSEEAPKDILLVSESGLKTRKDTQRVFDCGCNAILVGESLMRAGLPGIPQQVRELVGFGLL